MKSSALLFLFRRLTTGPNDHKPSTQAHNGGPFDSTPDFGTGLVAGRDFLIEQQASDITTAEMLEVEVLKLWKVTPISKSK